MGENLIQPAHVQNLAALAGDEVVGLSALPDGSDDTAAGDAWGLGHGIQWGGA